MTEVVFLDSSVLFNILEVPHKCRNRASVVAEFTQLEGNGAIFIFPMSALIDGDGSRLPLVEYATRGIGSGDASLLLEIERYRARVPSATPVRLRTLDDTLSAYS